MTSLKTTNKVLENKYAKLETDLKDLKETNIHHQRILTKVDNDQRSANIMVYGVEMNDSMVNYDKLVLKAIFNALKFENLEYSFHRIGREKKFILVTLKGPSIQLRGNILTASKNLKSLENFKADSDICKELKIDPALINLKKDLHPLVRAEWKRLNDVVKAESLKPENIGIAISLDPKTRKIFRGDPNEKVIIDQWSAHFY